MGVYYFAYPKNMKTTYKLVIKVLALLPLLSPVSSKSMCLCTSASVLSTQIPSLLSECTVEDTLADTAELSEIPYTEVFKMFYTKVKSIHATLHRHCKLAGQRCQGKKCIVMSQAVRAMANFWGINLP